MGRFIVALLMILPAASAVAADDSVIWVKLDPLPDFDIKERLTQISGPKRVWCRIPVPENSSCPALNQVRVVGSIQNSTLREVLSIVEKGGSPASEVVSDNVVAKATIPFMHGTIALGYETHVCYVIEEHWKCYKAGEAVY